jgi:hypothetical protein
MPETSARRLPPLLAALAAAAMLAACGGGGSDDPAGAAATDLPCNTALFVAGSVVKPTTAQIATYVGTYDGGEGSFGPNIGDPFVMAKSVVLVVNTDGSVTYDGTAYTPSSVCLDKAAGGFGTLLYVHTDKGHLDISDKTDPTLGRAWGVSLANGTTMFQGGVKR